MSELVVSLADVFLELFDEVFLLLRDIFQILALLLKLMLVTLILVLLCFPEPFGDRVLLVPLQLVQKGVLDLLISVDRYSSRVRFTELFVFRVYSDLRVHFSFDCVPEFFILRCPVFSVELHHVDYIFLHLGEVLDPVDGIKIVNIEDVPVLREYTASRLLISLAELLHRTLVLELRLPAYIFEFAQMFDDDFHVSVDLHVEHII